MWRLTTAALLATGACAVKVDLKSKFAGLNADAEEKNLAKPLTFHQKLLVCNAYPSDEGMVISKNAVHLASNEALPYNSCKYVDGKVFNKDRVNFSFQKAGIEGTFEVDELPSSDSVLLLIAQKRDAGKTDLMSFQSFAFPAADPNSNDAQVAFINTIPDTDKSERIRMSDAAHAKSLSYSKTAASREEDVLFNRVYVIESGSYDVDIVGGQFYNSEKAKVIAAEQASQAKAVVAPTPVHKDAPKHKDAKHAVAAKAEAHKPKKTSLLQIAREKLANFHTSKKISIDLERGQDYVILQTGGSENPTLIAFPGRQQPTGIVGFFKSAYHRMFSWI
jgi:hypothetical protein